MGAGTAGGGGAGGGNGDSSVQAATLTASSPPEARRPHRNAPATNALAGMRQLDVKVGTRAVVHQFDLAAVRGDVFMHDRQPDTAAALGIAWLALAPVKRFEDTGFVDGGNTRSLVQDVDAGPVRPVCHGKTDRCSHGAEAYGVGQEVTKSGAQLFGIDLDLQRFAMYHHLQLARQPLKPLLHHQI